MLAVEVHWLTQFAVPRRRSRPRPCSQSPRRAITTIKIRGPDPDQGYKRLFPMARDPVQETKYGDSRPCSPVSRSIIRVRPELSYFLGRASHLSDFCQRDTENENGFATAVSRAHGDLADHVREDDCKGTEQVLSVVICAEQRKHEMIP